MSATTAKHWFEKAVDWRATVDVDEAWKKREHLREDEKEHGHVGMLFKNSKQLPMRDAPVAALKPPATKEGKANTAEEEKQTHEYLIALARKIVDKRSSGGLTLVIVNTVERAADLYELLKAQAGGTAVHLIHSRFRPHERQGWKPILSKENTSTRIIISTQVVEAGVDFSAQVLFTELAPWASLVQRFGRCARYPDEAGRVYWMDLPTDSEFARPYEREELERAHARLREIGEKVGDVGLAALETLPLDDATRVTLLPYEPRFVPREKDIFELFDTTPDLTGADIDISRFIRDGREFDVLVYWREVPGGAPGKAERPLREELCPVAFYRFAEQVLALRKHGRIWRRHYRKGWEEIGAENTETIYPGQVFLLETTCGGYSEERGWTGDPDDAVAPVPVANATAVLPPEQGADSEDGSDEQCEASQWLTVAEHCKDVCETLVKGALSDPEIARALDTTGADLTKVLRLAARWHDRGKAHPTFQAKIESRALASAEARLALGDEPAGKAPKGAWLPPRDPTLPRPGFRHELASALGAMETLWQAQPNHDAFRWPEGLDKDGFGPMPEPQPEGVAGTCLAQELASLSALEFDLLLYLVAAHHGKVRMSLRSSPDDTAAPGEAPQARGVREGEELPACMIPDERGNERLAPKIRFSLDPMALGLSTRYGPSWRERTQALLETLGPFRLAYLEALLRAADWRASREERKEPADNHGAGYVRERRETCAEDRESLREFVRRWAEAGPALEEQRYAELQALDDETARRITLDLFKLWRPRAVDEMGGGLVKAQKVFFKLARREAAEKSRQ
jgi:CRISPR-associated endonuclease/helicase Cas3